jgi:DNA helicase HerA-like ATPase
MLDAPNANSAAAAGRQPFGRVLSSRGSEVRIGLPASVSLNAQRATVGKFVSIRSGASVLIGVIEEITVSEAAQAGANGYGAVAQVDLMGEIVRRLGGASRFQRGVRDYPAIGDEVEIVGRDDLRVVYSSVATHSISIGQLHQDHTIPAYVDADGMLSKHFAVLGSTGVGKSSGVAVILGELLKARPDVRILLLDIHNEYAKSFGDAASVVGGDNLKLPFWVFNFDEMTDVIYGGKQAVPEEVEILAELIPIAKGNYHNYKSGGERPALTKKGPRHQGFTADTPSPYLIQDLLTLIDERMGKLENRSSRMTHHRLMMRIEAIKNDPRYAFMFENANVGGDTLAAVLNQLFRLESESRGITILKLASLPGEVIDAVVCVAARLAFEFGLWSDGVMPLLLVCEEARRYAAADHSLGFAPVRRALSRIAKEGRKYGVHLGLVTQRPAELDPTIISQCSTLFVMRMANDEDQSILRSAVSDAGANLLSFVPSLGTGEVVGIGEGMPLPTRLSFRRLPQELLPCSETGSMFTEDNRELGRTELVRRSIERWRRATTNQTHPVEQGARSEVETPPAVVPDSAASPSALARGLQAIAAEGRLPSPSQPQRRLDPDRYTILKR